MNNLFNHFRDQREQRNRSITFWVGFSSCKLVLVLLFCSHLEKKMRILKD